MTISYNCDDKLLKVCGFIAEESKEQVIEMSTTSLCCDSSELITYYNNDYCSNKVIVDSIIFSNYTYSPDYTPGIPCLGWFGFSWAFSIDGAANIVSVNGTKTVTPCNGIPTTTNITSTYQLSGAERYYMAGVGELFEFDLNFITAEGCEINVIASFTTCPCEQCNECEVDVPIAGDITTTLVTNISNTFEMVQEGRIYCAIFDKELNNGITSIHLITPDYDIYTCLLIDCGSELECKITSKIADNILCTSCGKDINESFELYLEFQMLLSLLDCEKCCQACQLYNKIDNGLSKCNHC
jgi:hypothetical protein